MPDLFKDLQWNAGDSSLKQKDIILPRLDEKLIVNWGNGRLRRFQTRESFYAKFCQINQLTVSECVSFWETNLKISKKTLSYTHDVQIKRLAEILHEKEEIVESVFAMENYTRNFFGKYWSLLRMHQPKQYKIIRYCPICIQAGYHAYFHDYHAFKYCLIHQVKLEEKRFPWSNSPSQYQYYISHLGDEFENNDKYSATYKNFSETEKFLEACHEFENFMHWTKKVADKTLSMVSVSNRNINFNYHEILPVLFGKLLSLEQSESAVNLCHNNFLIRTEEPLVIRFSQQLMKDLNEITDVVPYNELLQIFLLTCLHDNTKHAFEIGSQNIISAIQDMHKQCTCMVGWKKATGWLKFEEPVDGYQGFLCPFHYVCKLIENNWLSTVDEINHHFIWDHRLLKRFYFMHTIDKLVDANWITVAGNLRQGFPQINFNWSIQLTFFLEAVLYSSMENFAESLVIWLRGFVRTNTLNVDVPFLPSNAYLKKLEGSEDVELYVWRTINN